MSSSVKYPKITVKDFGNDGNAFMLIGQVRQALRRGGVPHEEITKFSEEATSGNYDHVIQTCMKWVNCL